MTWLQRTRTLREELAGVAEPDPRWWLVAGAAAVAERFATGSPYLISDAEPAADTFIGHEAASPADPIADAIAKVRAAREAIRALDGTLPGQPLAVTVARNGHVSTIPSALDAAAFAIGDRVIRARLDDPRLPARIATGDGDPTAPPPFVCASIGDDALALARHGHRRAWTDAGGPWLGIGRSGPLATVSTCHFVVDGFGHALLAARIAAATADGPPRALPPLRAIAGEPLGIAWQVCDGPAPRALPLAYRLGCLLHRGRGAFSPTIQIPVAPARRGRVVPAVVSVRFSGGTPEPFAAFAARAKQALSREAAGAGLCARLMAAAQAVPAPLAWKRRSFSVARPGWLDRISEVLGGRACVSRIALDERVPPSVAVSSPARLASAADPGGACVVTVVDDGERAAITLCGSGLTGTHDRAAAILDELIHSRA